MLGPSPNNRTSITFALFHLLLLLSCWGPESASEKSENAFLQQVEYDHRDSSSNPSVIVKKSEDDRYCAAGFWSEEVRQRVWVLVRPVSEPFKVLPKVGFSPR